MALLNKCGGRQGQECCTCAGSCITCLGASPLFLRVWFTWFLLECVAFCSFSTTLALPLESRITSLFTMHCICDGYSRYLLIEEMIHSFEITCPALHT